MTAEKIIVYLVLLSVLILLHEYGHFFVARRNGVYVTDFALGMGPTLLKWTSPRSGTNYRLNLLPIGGYCQMKGEDGQTNEAEQQRAFRAAGTYDADNLQGKTPLQRLAIVLAGPIMNFIVALVLFFGAAMIFGLPEGAPTTQIFQLVQGSPADKAGMRVGDRIVAIDGVPMHDGNQLVSVIHGSLGKTLHLSVIRNGQPLAFAVAPKVIDTPNQGKIGFQPLPVSQRVGPLVAAQTAWNQLAGVTTGTLGALGGLFTHPKETASQFSGPIGIANATSQAQSLGWYPFLFLAGVISISLGIFNLLPVPALDGGRAVFILVEMLRGKPVDPEKEALVHVGGFAVLIALMLVVSFHDISMSIAGHAGL